MYNHHFKAPRSIINHVLNGCFLTTWDRQPSDIYCSEVYPWEFTRIWQLYIIWSSCYLTWISREYGNCTSYDPLAISPGSHENMATVHHTSLLLPHLDLFKEQHGRHKFVIHEASFGATIFDEFVWIRPRLWISANQLTIIWNKYFWNLRMKNIFIEIYSTLQELAYISIEQENEYIIIITIHRSWLSVFINVTPSFIK